MTLLRLIKFMRHLNTCFKSSRTKIHFENSPMNTLLCSQTVFLSNKNYVSLINNQANSNQDSDIDKKISIINYEMNCFGRITKFNIEDLLVDVQKSGSITASQGLFLLRCCSELMVHKSPKLRQELGLDIWSTLKKLKVTLDVSHYNALLNIFLETEYDFSPVDFLGEMVNANVKPNRVTFHRLIEQFCNQGKIDEAIQILHHMEYEEIPMSEEIMSSFIIGHFLNNNIDAAHEVLKSMESYDIKPTIRTFSAYLYGYAMIGNIEDIRKIIAECKDKEIWVPDKVFLRMAYHLALNNFTELIDEILSEAPKGDIYVREANKIMYKLIEKEQVDAAFKIFLTLPKKGRDYNSKSGNFLIQSLIDLNAPIEKSIQYCQDLEEKGINHRAFSSAIEKNMKNDLYDSSMALMKAWQELSGKIQMHYFYFILKSYGEAGKVEDVKKTVQRMVLEFGMNPDIYTLKNYVVPYMGNDMEGVLSFLVNYKVDLINASNAILLHLLTENEIRKAVKFMSSNYVSYKMGVVKYALLQAFKNTEDAPAFVWILHYIYQSSLEMKPSVENSRTVDQKYLSQNFVNTSILEAINFLSKSTSSRYLTIEVFRNLVDKGLSISPEVVKDIKHKLQQNVVLAVEDYLSKLGSGNLIPKPIQRELVYNIVTRKLTEIEKLESTAKLLSVSNKDAATQIKKNLLNHYCYSLNEKKAEELIKEFERDGVNISAAMHTLIVGMYLNTLNIEKAESWLTKIKEEIPDFKMSKAMIMKLVISHVRNGKLDKLEYYLSESTYPATVSILDRCITFLTEVSKYNDEDLLQRCYDLLDANGYIKEKGARLFAPFVKIHIARGDGKAALEKFEWALKTHSVLTSLTDLLKMFVHNNDEVSLNKVKNLCLEHNKRDRFYFELAMAYLECDQLDKAIDILENDCSGLHEEQVIRKAEKYYSQEEIDHLERFFEILNYLKYDVEKLCVLLLKSYGIQKEWEKGYNLWMKMQKENIRPSKTFVNTLYLAFKEKNIGGNENLQKFNKALKNFNILEAKKLLHSIPDLHKSDCYSKLCRYYASRGLFSEVLDLWVDLYTHKRLDLNPTDAAYILTIMTKNNDIENVEKVGEYMSNDLKKQIDYYNYLMDVYTQSGSLNVYLKKLENSLENGTADSKFRGLNKTALESIIKYPELCQQFENMIYKNSIKNDSVLWHNLWICYFVNQNPKSDEMWTKYLQRSKENVWTGVIHFLGYTNHPDIYMKVAELIKSSSLKSMQKLRSYTKLLNTLMKLDHPHKYEYAVKCLQNAMLEFDMEDFNMNVLVDLQIGLEKSGTPWPWSKRINEVDKTKLIEDIVR